MRGGFIMLTISAALLLVGLPAAPPAEKTRGEPGAGLASPVQLTAGNKLIDVEVGHAAPCIADIKGDGKPCLLVGQFGGGKLRIYPNVGSKTEPRFDKFEWFQASGKLGTVPAS